MRAPSLVPLALMAFTGLFIVFLYSPLAVLAVLSFQSGPEGGPQFPIIEWSTYWYRHLFGLVPPSRVAPLPIADALIRSLTLAGASTVPSTVLGALSAMLFSFTLSYDEFSRALFTAGGQLTLPLAIYGTFSVEIHPNIFAFGVLTTLFSFSLLAIYGVLMSLSVRRARRLAIQEE